MLTTNIQSFYSENPWITVDNFLNSEEIAQIKNSLMTRSLKKSNLMDNSGKLINAEHRISRISFISQSETEYEWLFQKILSIADSLNNQFFHYEIYGFDHLQYSEYDSANHGRYNWHVDAFIGANESQIKNITSLHRKLSITILLNDDFEGGEFQITLDGGMNQTDIPLNEGGLVAFPSFICHRVSDVVGGIRKSITCWVVGPKFR
jgi:PKHD-type hydroxylase